MASISLPFTLTAGAAENVNQLNSNLSTITSLVNGNIDGANAPSLAGHYRTITRVVSNFGSPLGGGGYRFMTGSAIANATGATQNPTVFYIDPADFAVTGLTTRYRVRTTMATGATAPGCSFTFGIYTVTAMTGGSSTFTITANTAVTGSTVLRAAPAANTMFTDASADFAPPAAGYFVFGVDTGSASTVNSFESIEMALQVRNV